MFRLRPTRKKTKVGLDSRTLRHVEAAFWFVLALAVGIGGQSVLSGLPKLGDLLLPSGSFAAEVRGKEVADFVALSLFGLPQRNSAPHIVTPADGSASWTRTPSAESAARPQDAARLPAIAIVIDDLGSDIAFNRRAIALPRAVALSFLPYPEATPMLAREGAHAGHEILVHLPMQAKDGEENPGPMALRIDYSPDENVRRLDWALSRVPFHVGINNHMGSRFTEDRRALIPVAEALYGRHIFFFDSRTSANSQVVPVARAFGVPSAGRDVFLDDVQTTGAVTAQLALLEKDARASGVATAIGHPHDVTLAVLARWCAHLKGYRLVPISFAMRMKTEREMSLAALTR